MALIKFTILIKKLQITSANIAKLISFGPTKYKVGN